MQVCQDSMFSDTALSPGATAMSLLLSGDLVTTANLDYLQVSDAGLRVAMINACAAVPALHTAVWPLVESLTTAYGVEHEALARVDWQACMKCHRHNCVVGEHDAVLRFASGLGDMNGDTAMTAGDGPKCKEVFEDLVTLCGGPGVADAHEMLLEVIRMLNVGHVNREGVTALLNTLHGERGTPLRIASVAVARLILQECGSECRLGQVDGRDGNTVLMKCAVAAGSRLTEDLQQLVASLLDDHWRECRLDHVNDAGNTVCMELLRNGGCAWSVATVVRLVRDHPDCCGLSHYANKDGDTLATLAARNDAATMDLWDALLVQDDFKATVGDVTPSGVTALLEACQRCHRHHAVIARLLGVEEVAATIGHVKHGRTACMSVAGSHPALAITMLKLYGARCNVGQRDVHGHTLFHIVAQTLDGGDDSTTLHNLLVPLALQWLSERLARLEVVYRQRPPIRRR